MNKLIEPISFIDKTEFDFDKQYLNHKIQRNILVEIHIADLHFGAINPRLQYEILKEQFVQEISQYPIIDIISIDGDTFDHKVMSGSDTAMYATMFANDIITIARDKGATVIWIEGTSSHDSKQTKLFSCYLADPTVDVRIVQDIKFEYVKGAKILCIPELYNINESVYNEVLHNSGTYDSCFMHGTIKGAVYGDNVGNGRLFTIEDFDKCRGPIFSGHIHKPGCFNKHFYYSGTPIRYKHGEEEPKGFIVAIHDLQSGLYQTEFKEIYSFKYRTINFDKLLSEDPKDIIEYILKLKHDEGIDNIKIKFKIDLSPTSKNIINNYFRNINDVNLEFQNHDKAEIIKKEKELEELNEFSFILDDRYSDEEKFVMYCNTIKGEEFVTVDMLEAILAGEEF